MLDNIRLGVKIGMGYGIIGIIFAISVGITLWQSEQNMTVITHLTEQQSPAVRSSLVMLNGLNRSLAALRGWVILGKDEFKTERSEAWKEDIEPSVQKLKELSKSWADKENLKRLGEIESDIGTFSKAQKEIEDIAQTTENTPATKLFVEEGEPLFKTSDSTLRSMIEIEQKLEANARRKALLGLMSDVQGTLSLSFANLKSYLITGDEKFKKEFELAWIENNADFKELSENADMLTPVQKQHLKIVKDAKEKFMPISAKIFEIRGGTHWNLANSWLAERAAPAAEAIKSRLNFLLASQIKTMEEEQAEVGILSKRFRMIEWILLGVGLLLCALAGYVITRSITRPLRQAVDIANRLAGGDLTMKIETKGTDEAGQLLSAIHKMVSNLRKMVSELSSAADQLSASSQEMSAISSQMAASAEETDNQASVVASSAEQISVSVSSTASATEQAGASVSGIASMTEEMSSTFANMVGFAIKTSENVKTIAASSDQISSGVQSAASASEEMTASLNEVAKNTAQANLISQNANRRAEEIDAKMQALSSASKQIGKIVGVIRDIADQTNMLALNATIEAAGAGDAGRGFAVVAGEVKELAKQSAEATDEIAGQIEQIQASTNEAVMAIAEISKTITEIAAINESIAASVEEQSATANEISRTIAVNAVTVRNVAKSTGESSTSVTEFARLTEQCSATASEVSRHVEELARGIQDVAKSSTQAALGVKEISENIQSISIASNETATGASRASMASDELSQMASGLTEIIKRFTL
jgi:methyl-accepting chemotaxis protein